jgi:hypothetical protein
MGSVGRPAFIIAGVAVLAAAAGAGIGIVNPTVRPALIGGMALVIIIPLAVRVARREFDIFEPLTVMGVALLVMFVVRPLALLVSQQTTYIGYDIMAHFDEALLVAYTGCLAFVLGYALPVGRGWAAKVPPLPSAFHTDTLVAYALALVILGLLLYGVFLGQSGGLAAFNSILAGRQPEQDAFYRSSTGYFYQGMLLMIPASLLLLAGGLVNHRRGLVMLAVLVMLPLLLVGGATGGRLNLMILLGGPVVFAFLHAGSRPGWLPTLVALFLALTVGVGFLRDARNAADRTDSRVAVLRQSVTNPGLQVERLFLEADTGMFDTLALEVSVVPDELPYQHGALLTDPLVRAVPRPLWPTKPLESNDRLIDTLWPQHYAVNRASSASSIVGNLYQDSGLLTVFLGMLAIGAFLRGLWAWLRRWKHMAGAQLLFASILPLAVVLARGNFVSVLSIGGFTVLPVAIGLWLARRPEMARTSVPTSRRRSGGGGDLRPTLALTPGGPV